MGDLNTTTHEAAERCSACRNDIINAIRSPYGPEPGPFVVAGRGAQNDCTAILIVSFNCRAAYFSAFQQLSLSRLGGEERAGSYFEPIAVPGSD